MGRPNKLLKTLLIFRRYTKQRSARYLSLLMILGNSIKTMRKNNEEELIYGRKFGTALTLKAFLPVQKNGGAIILILSEGWYSNYDMIDPVKSLIIDPILDSGYCVFAVIHGSNPRFSIPDAIDDIHRAVRFIRFNSPSYGIDPDRLGILGGSAAGHLALSVACKQLNQDLQNDDISAVSSDVAAAAIFFPLVDFLNWGEAGKTMLGDHPAVPLFGAFDFDELNAQKQRFERIENVDSRRALAKALSPLEWVNAKQAPTYLVVGDADPVVPPEQSYRLADKMKIENVVHQLEIIPDGGHDMNMIADNLKGVRKWFDTHLTS